MSSPVTRWLERARPGAFSAYAIAAAFTAYFCMYAFRKPWAATDWEGQSFGPLELKIALGTGQLMGYALSKFIGIKFVAEISPSRRAGALIALVLFAELALLAMAVLPAGGKVIAIFFNGLPLGAVWGLVFGFLEGRRTSEILGAGLSASYVVASGMVKSVGATTIEWGVPEAWMPVTTGALFLPLFFVAVWALRQLPPPTQEDERERTARTPMHGTERKAFVKRFAFGLVALTGLYTLLTAYRNFRDDFAKEIWIAVGLDGKPELFTITEVPVAFAVLGALALVYRIRDNRRAFFWIHGLMAVGTVLLAVATLLFDAGAIGPIAWMALLGTGLYLAYVPYGCVLFDRLIAATGATGTAVFMIYVTDAFGYVGAITVNMIKNFTGAQLSWLTFFRGFSYLTALVCTAAFAASAWYFSRAGRTDAVAAATETSR